MSGFAEAVQTAMFNRLNAASLPGNPPVFTVVPDDQKPPAVVIAESVFDEISSKTGSEMERHVVTVRAFMTGTSKTRLLRLMAAIRTALHRQPLLAPGFDLGRAEALGGDEIREPDEGYLVGSQTFLVFAQAA